MILICARSNVKEDKLFHHWISLGKSEQLTFLEVSIQPGVYNLASECRCKLMREAGEQCFLASVRFLWHFCYSGCSRSYNRSVCASDPALIRKWQLCSDGLGHRPEQMAGNNLRVWLEKVRLLTSLIFFISNEHTLQGHLAVLQISRHYIETKSGICFYFLPFCKCLVVPIPSRALSLYPQLWGFRQGLAACALGTQVQCSHFSAGGRCLWKETAPACCAAHVCLVMMSTGILVLTYPLGSPCMYMCPCCCSVIEKLMPR